MPMTVSKYPQQIITIVNFYAIKAYWSMNKIFILFEKMDISIKHQYGEV